VARICTVETCLTLSIALTFRSFNGKTLRAEPLWKVGSGGGGGGGGGAPAGSLSS